MVAVLLGRLQDVFDQEPEQVTRALRAVEALDGHVRLHRVGFSYGDRAVISESRSTSRRAPRSRWSAAPAPASPRS